MRGQGALIGLFTLLLGQPGQEVGRLSVFSCGNHDYVTFFTAPTQGGVLSAGTIACPRAAAQTARARIRMRQLHVLTYTLRKVEHKVAMHSGQEPIL